MKYDKNYFTIQKKFKLFLSYNKDFYNGSRYCEDEKPLRIKRAQKNLQVYILGNPMPINKSVIKFSIFISYVKGNINVIFLTKTLQLKLNTRLKDK